MHLLNVDQKNVYIFMICLAKPGNKILHSILNSDTLELPGTHCCCVFLTKELLQYLQLFVIVYI